MQRITTAEVKSGCIIKLVHKLHEIVHAPILPALGAHNVRPALGRERQSG